MIVVWPRQTTTTSSSSAAVPAGARWHGAGAVGQAHPAPRTGRLPAAERDNWDTDAVFLRGKYLTTETWLDVDGNGFTPEQNYYVGGNTKFYGAALFRLRPEDFGELRHHGGLSPAWPISYADFEP